MRFTVICATILVAAATGAVADYAPHCDDTNIWNVYPDPTDCAKFYRCEHYEAVSHTCVENTLYDKQLRACNWDNLVDCDANPLFPIHPAVVCPEDDDPNRPTHLPHPEDCGKFYKCWDGVPVEMDCPAGFYWNQVLIYCDFPNNVPCANKKEE